MEKTFDSHPHHQIKEQFTALKNSDQYQLQEANNSMAVFLDEILPSSSFHFPSGDGNFFENLPFEADPKGFLDLLGSNDYYNSLFMTSIQTTPLQPPPLPSLQSNTETPLILEVKHQQKNLHLPSPSSEILSTGPATPNSSSITSSSNEAAAVKASVDQEEEQNQAEEDKTKKLWVYSFIHIELKSKQEIIFLIYNLSIPLITDPLLSSARWC